MKNQNENIRGISESSRLKRKRMNLVSLKFNFLNWIIETVSTLLVILIPSDLATTSYILLNSCATPMVYFLGMRENRSSVVVPENERQNNQAENRKSHEIKRCGGVGGCMDSGIGGGF